MGGGRLIGTYEICLIFKILILNIESSKFE